MIDWVVVKTPDMNQTPRHMREKSVGTPTTRMSDHSASACFALVFPYDLWVHIVNETNIHGAWLAEQDTRRVKKALKFKACTVSEIKTLHGLMIAMSLQKYTNLDCYWRKGKLGAVKFPDFGVFMTKSDFLCVLFFLFVLAPNGVAPYGAGRGSGSSSGLFTSTTTPTTSRRGSRATTSCSKCAPSSIA